jgi:hypothetical protein
MYWSCTGRRRACSSYPPRRYYPPSFFGCLSWHDHLHHFRAAGRIGGQEASDKSADSVDRRRCSVSTGLTFVQWIANQYACVMCAVAQLKRDFLPPTSLDLMHGWYGCCASVPTILSLVDLCGRNGTLVVRLGIKINCSDITSVRICLTPAWRPSLNGAHH